MLAPPAAAPLRLNAPLLEQEVDPAGARHLRHLAAKNDYFMRM